MEKIRGLISTYYRIIFTNPIIIILYPWPMDIHHLHATAGFRRVEALYHIIKG